jgi:hypothetical protein
MASLGPNFAILSRITPLLLCLLLHGCGHEPTAPDPRLESEHFLFIAEAGDATQAEMEDGIQRAEAHFAAIAGIIGAERVPSRTITVVLRGSCDGMRVDEEGRMLLCRYSAALGGYYGALAHELTHAMRYDFWAQHGTWSWPSFGFFEEGFAEFVALLVDPDKLGSPFFGYPEDVVAGYWVVTGQAIPNDILRPRNQELNDPCTNQAYPQRASWFHYIDDTYGRAAVLAVAYSQVEVTSEVAETLLGVGLAQVDSGWEQWVSARYDAIPNADSLAQAYRRWVPESTVCVAGVDY